jgi:O-succinylbenzoic acid--CoA ligase
MDWLARCARDRGDAPAIVVGERVVSYRDLDRAADAVASIVIGSGLAGKTVAFWGVRDASTAAALWGIPRAGSAAVPIDPRLPPAEAMQMTRDAGVTGLWAVPEGGIDRLLERRAVVGRTGWGPPNPGARFVVFTSGSEGSPKGVVIDGANIAASVVGSRDRLGNGPDDRWLCVLPLFHVGGLSIFWRQAEAGAPVVLEETFDPGRVGAHLGEVAWASLVPTMLRRVLDAGPGSGARVLLGGGPSDPALIRRALDAGIVALQTYGMTETTSQVCTVAPADALGDVGTAGTPIAGAELRITRDGAEVAPGVEGRIEVRGPMVSAGYLGGERRAPDAWMVTGDLGALDDRGRLTVVGRADALIVTGGENVHPLQVERVLRDCPGVVDAHVFGVPDPEWGRRVVAEVVLESVAVTAVAAWARDRLSPAAVPKEWRVVPRLAGKLEG